MIDFDLDIYSARAVYQAVKDYGGIADISCTRMDSCIRCILGESRYARESTMLEFSNYVLALSLSMKRDGLMR